MYGIIVVQPYKSSEVLQHEFNLNSIKKFKNKLIQAK